MKSDKTINSLINIYTAPTVEFQLSGLIVSTLAFGAAAAYIYRYQRTLYIDIGITIDY